MNIIQGMTVSLAAAIGGLACSAQNTVVPIRQIEKEAQNVQLSARAAIPSSEAPAARPYALSSGPSSSASLVFVPPVVKNPRTLSPGFLVLNGLHLGLAILDVETTQHCIADHHCIEGNPLMPSSFSGRLGEDLGLVGYSTFVSYRLRKRDSKLWILAPTVGISAHTVGIASGIAHW